ncbi:MAG: winged helix-turn-helix transcriptional regulator [Promethearchaeota archaeon]
MKQGNRRMIWVIVLIVTVLSIIHFPTSVSSQSADSFYQILYVSQSDLELAQKLETNLDLHFYYYNLSEMSSGDQSSLIPNREGVVLIASEIFSDSSNFVGSYLNSMINARKRVVLFTPFVANISGTSRQMWGMDTPFTVLPRADSFSNFSLQLTNESGDVFSEYMEQTFAFEGRIAVSSLPPSAHIYANIINCTGCEDPLPTFPVPLIYAPTQVESHLLVMPLAYNDTLETNRKTLMSAFQGPVDFELILSAFIANFLGGTLQIPISTTVPTEQPFNSVIQQVAEILPEIAVPATVISLGAALLIWFRKFIIDLFKTLWNSGVAFLALIGTVVFRPVHRRLSDDEVSDNSIRREIIWFLQECGENGAYFNEIKTRLNLGTGQLVWHLEILKDFYIIGTYTLQRHVIYYLTEFSLNVPQKKLEIALKSPVAREIIENLLKSETLSATELSKLINRHRKTVTNHLEKFTELGVVDSQKNSQKRLYYLTKPEFVKVTLDSFSEPEIGFL